MSGGVTVRAATLADESTLYEWRNDPRTRIASRNRDAIPFNVHVEWLHAVLLDPGRILLIGETEEHVAIGTVRFDARADGPGSAFEVSVNVAPSHRGRGLSRHLLLTAEEHLREAVGGPTVLANIRPENAPSLKLFRSCGYTPTDSPTDSSGLWLAKLLGSG